MQDADMIVEAGLSGAMEAWQGITFWSGLIAAVAAAVAAFCTIGYFVAKDRVDRIIPAKADEFRQNKRAELAEKPPSTWPIWYLEEEHWTPKEITGGLKLYVEPSEENTAVPHAVDALIKDENQTLVWARLIPLGDQYVWPYAQDNYELEDGDNTIEISKAIAGTGISKIIRENDRAHIDIIGVGLESSHGGSPDGFYRQLSDDRGGRLIEAAEQNIETPFEDRKINYRTLGLGRALTPAEKGTTKEKRQRSALLLVIARMSHDDVMLPLNSALKNLIMEVNLNAVDLKDYEYSCALDSRLSPPLVDDPSLDSWEVPPLSVEEALAMRPCQLDLAKAK